jgi:hypothetical protein
MYQCKSLFTNPSGLRAWHQLLVGLTALTSSSDTTLTVLEFLLDNPDLIHEDLSISS